MAFSVPGSMSRQKPGFFGVLGFYALGLGAAMGLVQIVPVAAMCNPGLPLYAVLLTLMLGACGLVNALLAFLLGNRTRFLRGFLAARSLRLVMLVVLISGILYGA